MHVLKVTIYTAEKGSWSCMIKDGKGVFVVIRGLLDIAFAIQNFRLNDVRNYGPMKYDFV